MAIHTPYAGAHAKRPRNKTLLHTRSQLFQARLKAEKEVAAEAAEHIAGQRTVTIGNPYSSFARAALAQNNTIAHGDGDA